MNNRKSELVAKVPQVTLLFWIIKILATTLGETGGDAVTMSWLGETTEKPRAPATLSARQYSALFLLPRSLSRSRRSSFTRFSTG